MNPAQDPEIIVDKAARTLSLVRAGRLERRYPIALGRNAGADKCVEGDCATPLGDFFICAKNPHSRFFLSLCLSYPNAGHAGRGLRDGLITPHEYALIMDALRDGRMPPQKTRLGGEIYIHGEDPGAAAAAPQVRRDWTHGCIALDNGSMQELYATVPIGTAVSIRP
ncbi:MAG: murein L,D-transpeptidase family protein [Steroidobacterales bacterium]